MGFCKPYDTSDGLDKGSRKVLERNGIRYETQFFRISTPKSQSVISRIVSATSKKDKHRLHVYGPNLDMVIAQSDSFDEVAADWMAVLNEYLPIVQKDPKALSTIPDLVSAKVHPGVPAPYSHSHSHTGSNGNGGSRTSVNKSGSTSNTHTHHQRSSEGDSINSYRRASKAGPLKEQRESFELKIKDMAKLSLTSNERQDLSDYDIMRTLGTGSFGRVLMCKKKETGQFCAMKIIRKEIVIKLKQVEHTANEKNILACIDCPFIVQMIEFFSDKKSLYFVLEFINGGEMFTHIHRNRYFTSDVARFFAAETVLAFEYLHNLDIVYRDLKPENLLIDSRGHLRITDFGFAKRVADRTWTLCGTPEYLAPEIILSKGYAHAVDWWALGILIYEMRCGHAPFYDEAQMEMYKKIVEGRLVFPTHFKSDERSIISGFLTSDLTKRLGNMRSGVLEIKKHPFFKSIDWQAMYAKKVISPYIPKTSGEGDDSNFDKYDEEPIKWHGTGTDPYAEIFKNF